MYPKQSRKDFCLLENTTQSLCVLQRGDFIAAKIVWGAKSHFDKLCCGLVVWEYPEPSGMKTTNNTVIAELSLWIMLLRWEFWGADWSQCWNNGHVYLHLYLKHRFICFTKAIFVERTKLKLKLLTDFLILINDWGKRRALATSLSGSAFLSDQTVSIFNTYIY